MNNDFAGALKEAQDRYDNALAIDGDAFLHDDAKAEFAKADKEFAKAYAIYETLANAGNPEALYRQGYCLCVGTGAKPDKTKAAECFRKAAAQGHAPAQAALKELEERGYLTITLGYKVEVEGEQK